MCLLEKTLHCRYFDARLNAQLPRRGIKNFCRRRDSSGCPRLHYNILLDWIGHAASQLRSIGQMMRHSAFSSGITARNSTSVKFPPPVRPKISLCIEFDGLSELRNLKFIHPDMNRFSLMAYMSSRNICNSTRNFRHATKALKTRWT